jgi:hypothetical protein
VRTCTQILTSDVPAAARNACATEHLVLATMRLMQALELGRNALLEVFEAQRIARAVEKFKSAKTRWRVRQRLKVRAMHAPRTPRMSQSAYYAR